MPDNRKAIDDKFWKWVKDAYGFGRFEAGVKSIDLTPYWNYFWATQLSPEERQSLTPTTAPTTTDTVLPKGVTQEQWNQFLEYRQNGGELEDVSAWKKAGSPIITLPNATEEGSSSAWLDSLDAFLQAQVDSKSMSLEEAVLISDDMEDRLLGLGKYEGARQTVIDLPPWVRTDVENYRKSLPIQEQKRLDEESRIRQQQAQDIAAQQAQLAQQQMQLPLNAGGTIPQQIQAGQQAIRNLQIQLGVAPDYMQDTIRGQIADLEKGISQLQETDLAMAKERAVEMGWDEEAPAEPVPGPDVVAFAEKYSMSPEAAMKTAGRYAADRESIVGEESGEFANLTREQQRDLSVAANEEEQRMSDEAPPRTPKPAPLPDPFEDIPTFGELGVAGSPTWKRWFEQRYPTIVSQFRGKEAKERTEAGWTGFLEKERARIKAEFTKQSPYARGERPGAFAPKIKTVAW